jgi:CubicO group peptidase (beta-lactamase class C family)
MKYRPFSWILGDRFYEKTLGKDKLGSDASPLTTNHILMLASATKLATSIAALQCVERGLVSLDEPIERILPELKAPDIISWEDESAKKFSLSKSTTLITLRHLLTHSSGLTYEWDAPILHAWHAERGEPPIMYGRGDPVKLYTIPLIFEPGQGWAYGPSFDWVGIMIKRLHNTTVADYFAENIFKILGRVAPFPVFNAKDHPEYFARRMAGVNRTESGELEYDELSVLNDCVEEFAGHGLAASTEDYLPILQDIISPKPKLLSVEYTQALFTPQFIPGSAAEKVLLDKSGFFDPFSRGSNKTIRVNHGLGGLFTVDPIPEIGQPANVLLWSSLANSTWFANREIGVAGFFGTQTFPFNDGETMDIAMEFKKDFWAKVQARGLVAA